MIKGFFFDLDGTLVNTHEANFEAYKRALADFGIDLTYEAFKQTIGMQATAFLPIIAPAVDSKDYPAITAKKAAYYKVLAHMSELNESLRDFIHYLKANHQIALVTTAKRQNAEVILQHHRLVDLFDFVISADDVKNSKPSPECYELALKRSGLQANEAIAFEDSETGRQAAEAAGIAVVMVTEYVA